MLRACYSTNMRFYPDRPDVLTPIQWYFTDPDAPWIGKENVFNSRVWYDGEEWDAPPVLGEDMESARHFVSGLKPEGMVNTPCQTSDDVWLNGVPFDQAGSAPYNEQGQLLCCLAEPLGNEVLFESFAISTTEP